LVKWKGEAYSASAADVFGGGIYNYDLKSECVNGKYAYIHVFASGVGLGAGYKFDLTGGVTPVTFDDGNFDLDTNTFNGLFQVFSAGAGVGLTGGWSFTRLGNAFSVPGWKPDPGIGLDASVGAFIGKSHVWKAEIKDCCPRQSQ
jgi:hypothetical protein